MTSRRKFIQFVIGAGIAVSVLFAGAVWAQDVYPSRPIRVIVPYAAGGPTDLLARLMAEQMNTRLGQPVVVENRPGGSGLIALEAIARSAPDGYTLGFGGSVQIAVFPRTNFHPLNDFSYIAQMSTAPHFWFISTSIPPTSIQELVAYAKANPGQINYGIAQIAGEARLLVERFQLETGATMTPVVYKGVAPIMQDLVAGRIHLTIMSNNAIAKPFVETGKLRILGVSFDRRPAFAPEVPTLTEQGLPSVRIPGSQALVGPRGLPRPVVSRLEQTVKDILSTPEVLERLKTLAIEPSFLGSEQVAEQLRRDAEFVATIAKKAGIKAEE